MKFSFEISRGAKKTESISINSERSAFMEWLDGKFWTKNGSKQLDKLKKAGFDNPYVYMVISDIAQTISRLRYDLMLGEKQVTTGKLYELLARPNKNQYTTEFFESALTELLSTGEIFIAKTTSIGFNFPTELNVLLSQCVEVFVTTKNEIAYYQYTFNGVVTRYDTNDILHIKLSNPIDTNGEKAFRGYAPLRVLERVTDASNSNFNAEASILENRGVQGFISGNTNMPLLDDDKELLQNSFDKRHNGSSKFGKIAVTSTEAKYVSVGANTADLQLLDSNPAKLRVICGVFKLAPQLFGDTSASTFNNMEEARKSAYIKCYLPLARFFVDQLNKWFIDSLKTKEQLTINEDAIELLKSINKDFSTKIVNEVKAGIISPQQALTLLYPDLQYDTENARPQGAGSNQTTNN